jgi:beta-fructofuranosidase
LTKAKRVGWKLVSKPYDLSPVLGRELASNDSFGNSTLSVDYSDVESNAIYWEVNVTGIPDFGVSSTASMNFTFLSPVTNESIKAGYFFGGDSVYFLDRGGARGFDNIFFTDKTSLGSLASNDGSWNTSGVIDRSIFEAFLDGGVDSVTNTFFATEPLTRMIFSTKDLPEDVKVSISVRALESAWQSLEGEDGLVHGNKTSSTN